MRHTISIATEKDFKYLLKKDIHVSRIILRQKIKAKEIIILKNDNQKIGWLRFGYFWDSIPFMSMLMVEKKYREQGLGRKLVDFWETEMKKKKYNFVLTSTQNNETAKYFYKKIGYKFIGSFTLPKEPKELMFYKNI